MEEERGMTLGDIFKVIFKKIWWVLGAVALGIILVVLVVELCYNRSKEYYEVNYEIVYPDSDSKKYPDGNDFILSECVSLNTLTKIKESSDEFSAIDVEKMLQKDEISVQETVVKAADESVKRTYTLTANAKYFKDDEQAVKFMRAAVSYPVDRVLAIIDSKEYGLFLETFDSAKTYEEKIAVLVEQKNYISDTYNMLKEYDKSVEKDIASLRNVFTDTERNALYDRIGAYFYEYDTTTIKADADSKIANLQKKIADNEKIIEALRVERDRDNATPSGSIVGDGVWTNSYDYQISQLIIKNQEMQNEIDDVEKKLAAITKYETAGTEEFNRKKSFDDLLLSYKTALQTEATKLRDTSIRVYDNNSSVIYAGNKVEKEGGMNAILAAVLGALVGFIIAGVVICIIDMPKYLKNKYAQGATAEPVKEGAEGETTANNSVEATESNSGELPESGNE